MTTSVASKAHSPRIQELETELGRVHAQIASIQKRLKDLERFHDPDSLPYITFKPISRIEDLRAPRVPLRAALRNDIKKLQEAARALQAELQAAKRKQHAPAAIPPHPHRPPVHHGPVHSSPGHGIPVTPQSVPAAVGTAAAAPVDPEIQRLADIAEKTLDQRLAALDASPSFDNMHDVLESMKELSLVGRDTDHAMAALQVAAGKRVNFATSILQSDCTDRNVVMVLMITKEAALLGNDEASEAGIKAAAEATVKLRKQSEQKFRTAPTLENLQAFLKAGQNEGLLGGDGLDLDNPPGLPFVRPGTFHTVKPGETLQQISQHYFGSPGWWDVIVFRNFEKLRGLADPNKIVPGTLLKIS